MAGIYKMTQRELSALLSAAGQHGLYGFAEVLPAESKEREGCEDALLERHYLRDGGQQGKQLEDGLGLLIATTGKPFAYFSMEDLRDQDRIQKTVIYFRDDLIVLTEQREKSFEILGLPYLPLVIGETANLHEPYLNPESQTIREEAVSADSGWIDEYLKNGYGWQWEMWGEWLEDDRGSCSIVVLSDGKEQLMIREKDGVRKVFKPDKAAYVNQITEVLADLHSRAMRKMLEKEG